MDRDYGDQRRNERRGQADLHDAPGPIFRRWKDERRNGRTVHRRASNRTYCNCRPRLSNDDCTMAPTSILSQITIKNCVLGGVSCLGAGRLHSNHSHARTAVRSINWSKLRLGLRQIIAR